jgi:ADP-ribose pyrophosphatase
MDSVERKILHQETRQSGHGEELRWMIVRERYRHPDTGEDETRAVIRHPGVVVIVALPAPDQILLVRQYRHAVGASLWEVPAGTLSGRGGDGVVVSDERPDECAARELEEETGWSAGRLEMIGMCYPMPGGSDERLHVFVARELTPGTQALDPGEAIAEVRGVDVREVFRMIATGEITDGKTVSAMLYALTAGVVAWTTLSP